MYNFDGFGKLIEALESKSNDQVEALLKLGIEVQGFQEFLDPERKLVIVDEAHAEEIPGFRTGLVILGVLLQYLYGFLKLVSLVIFLRLLQDVVAVWLIYAHSPLVQACLLGVVVLRQRAPRLLVHFGLGVKVSGHHVAGADLLG